MNTRNMACSPLPTTCKASVLVSCCAYTREEGESGCQELKTHTYVLDVFASCGRLTLPVPLLCLVTDIFLSLAVAPTVSTALARVPSFACVLDSPSPILTHCLISCCVHGCRTGSPCCSDHAHQFQHTLNRRTKGHISSLLGSKTTQLRQTGFEWRRGTMHRCPKRSRANDVAVVSETKHASLKTSCLDNTTQRAMEKEGQEATIW